MHHIQQRRDQQDLRLRWLGRRNQFVREFEGRLSARLLWGHLREVLSHRETTPLEDSQFRRQGPPGDAWFLGRWRKALRRSIDTEHDYAPENLGVRKTSATTSCLKREYPQKLDGRRLANRRANHPTVDTVFPSEDPMVSERNN